MASYGERRRHYRVGKKAAENGFNKQSQINKTNKNKLIAGAVAIGIVIFIKGLLLGMLISKD